MSAINSILAECGVKAQQSLHEVHVADIRNYFAPSGSFFHHISEQTSLGIKFYPVGGSRLVLSLKHPATLYFRGVLGIKCLAGKVELDGYILNSDQSADYDAYSLPSHSASCFSSLDCNIELNGKSINELKKLNIYEDIEKYIENSQPSCLLLLWKSDFSNLSQLSGELKQILWTNKRFYGGSAIFSEFEEFVNCVFDIPTGNRISKKINFSQNMKDYASVLLTYRAPRLLICGGKGVGKSTYTRYMVNQMLSKWAGIIFVDFDIGQPEFTVPGCVSIHFITKPLFGPNYSHLNFPLKCIFLGFVSADKCFNSYVSAIENLKKFWSSYPASAEIPLVINTMGYVKGFGLLLINKIISQFDLTHVAELRSSSEPGLNFARSPGPENVMSSLENCPPLNFVLDTFEQMTSNLKSTLSAKTLRELMTFAYFAGATDALRTQTVHIQSAINGSGIPFVSLTSNSSVLLRGEIVAVCTSDSEECLGFGKVVSYTAGVLSLLTPLPEIDFKNCVIIRGDLSIRNEFFNDNLPDGQISGNNAELKILLTSGKNALCPALFSFNS